MCSWYYILFVDRELMSLTFGKGGEGGGGRGSTIGGAAKRLFAS